MAKKTNTATESIATETGFIEPTLPIFQEFTLSDAEKLIGKIQEDLNTLASVCFNPEKLKINQKD